MQYARFNLFRQLMSPFSRDARKERMARLEALMKLKPGARVLDLGGQPYIWTSVSTPLEIVILNLPGVARPASPESIHRFDYVEGDACNVHLYKDNSFDLVFCNSVIEHVGGPDKQRALAQEVHRLAPKYWVQTPSIWFPVEAHTGMPFWFFMPGFVRDRVIRNWEKSLPEWTEMVKGTKVISRRAMCDFFPGARLLTERKFLIPKSYILYRD